MMDTDDSSRGNGPQPGGRRAPTPKFQDNRYSPSVNYNYNNGGTGNGNSFQGQNQHPRRRTDRFKRETLNFNERLAQQNDLIIRLLREIRDRLPPPPPGTAPGRIDAVDESVDEGDIRA